MCSSKELFGLAGEVGFPGEKGDVCLRGRPRDNGENGRRPHDNAGPDECIILENGAAHCVDRQKLSFLKIMTT